MNFLFEIFINALEAFLILEFLSHYFGFKNKSNIRYLGFIFMWIISIISITFFSWNKSFEIYSSFSQVLINIIFCILMLKGNIITKIFISAFTMVSVVLLSSFTAFFIGHIHKNSINEIYTQFNLVRIIAIFMSKVLFFQVTRIILRIKTNNLLSKLDIIPFIIIPIISMCTISLLTNVVLLYPNSQKTIFYSICLIIVLSILTYYLFVRLNESAKIRYEYKLLKLKYEYEKQNIDDIKNMYENIRSIHHDMTNHLICIGNLINDNKNNSQAYKYIQGLLNGQEFSKGKIIFSDNDALDAIINAKEILAYKYGINFKVVIADSLKFMSDEDICILFGNLFDNAIFAAKQTVSKQISLKIQPQDTYVSIVISNSINTNVLKYNPELKTTRLNKDGHGYGIKNIKRIVGNYNGMVRFYEEDDNFISDILLLNNSMVN